MARQEHQEDDARDSSREPRIYVPCPSCGRAMVLTTETRIADDLAVYVCPHCGAAFARR